MKEKLSLLTVLAVLSISLPAQGQPWLGSGTEGDPYLIEDANDMQAIGADPNYWNSHFLLVNDINLAQFTGTQFNIIGNDSNAFTGVFDGNGHSISNFIYSDNTGLDNIGIFGCVNDVNTEIRDLTLINADVFMVQNSSLRIGSLVGWLQHGTIRDCHALSVRVVGGNTVGGLVGQNDNGVILRCDVSGGSGYRDLYGEWDVYGKNVVTGGLVGLNYGVIDGCYTHVRVSSSLWNGGLVGRNFGTVLDSHAEGRTSGIGQVIGGLVGSNYGTGTISNCYATGKVDVIGSPGSAIGGLAGSNHGAITNCYASGNVSGITAIGGLIGHNGGGPTTNCYAVGVVSGNEYLGGFAGRDNGDGSYLSCFWDSDVNPDVNGIGNITDSNVIGKPIAEMLKESTFTDADWDFVEVWNIGENQTYPYLRVYPVGDLNHDFRVDFFDFAILANHWLAGVE